MINSDSDLCASSFSALPAHNRPVDRRALVVGFFRGEHFDADFSRRTKNKVTMIAPPKAPNRPATVKDYTGKRNGQIVCCFWWSKTRDNEGSVWVVRCDCGNYEFRSKPGKWDAHPNNNDACEHCQRKREMIEKAGSGNSMRFSSSENHPYRLVAFIKKLRGKGLSDKEIEKIIELNIHAKGSADEIRSQLAAAQGECR